MYRPPNSGSDYWDLIEQTFDNLCDSHTDLVILGDFNSDLLKPMHANRIQNLTNSYNLHQLIDEPTHYTENSSSLLDLAIVSKPENVVYSGVSSPFIPDLIRYHCPIIVTLKFRKPIQKPFKRHIWLYDKGDYNKYKRLLSENDWSFISAANNVDEIADKVSSIIIEAAKQSIPFKEITVRPNEPPWINSNIKRQIRQRKRLFKRAKKSNNENIWTQFRTKRNSVTASRRIAKQEYIEKIAKDLRSNDINSKSWHKISSNLLRSSSKQTSIPFLETTSGITETDNDKAEILNHYFASQSDLADRHSSPPDLELPNYPMLENIHISPDEVKQAIKQLKPNKAPGPNLIGPKLFKEASNELATPLSDMYNLSLTTKTYPASWKKANVCPIFKKDNPCKLNNYRPISLLNYEGKIMERCVHKHISEYLEANTIISEFQSGFKPTDSTINQLAYLCNEFAKDIDESKEIRVVFLDISKAFDRVWHKGLLAKLRAIGFSENIVEWFSSYLENRKQRVCLGGIASAWLSIFAGVPQGSILGPILFLIFINDIVKYIRTNIRLFADDTILYKVVHNIDLAAAELNIDLESIKFWAKIWKVVFNPLKSKSLLITKKNQTIQHPPLIMSQSQIEEVNEHKHLGITFCRTLTWTNHISEISRKAWKRIGSLRRYKFLLDRGSLFKMYTTFIRPLLEYGGVVWDSCSNENKRLIEKIQVEALRITTGGTKVCSLQKLYDDLSCETLEQRRHKHKLFLLYKIINNLAPNYLMQLLPPRVQQFSRYPLRNSEDFAIPVTRTTTYYNSFLPTALRDWNVLSLDTRNAPTLNSFKHTLRNNHILVPKYFDTLHVSRIAQILHNRIRLECSSLNSHLFKKNLIDNQLCSCGSIETTSHFFFSCPRYTAKRQQYLLNLPHELSVSLLLRGDPSQPCTVNNIILKHAQLYILATKRFL